MITLETRLKQPSTAVKCVHCATELEYTPPTPLPDEPFQLRCAKCSQTWIIRPTKPANNKKRRIGTDEKPLDLSYYELLGVDPTCSQDDIKKAYRRLAIKHHPDKNPNDEAAAERFKNIAIAYSTLSDEGLRHAYNEFGKGKGDGQSEDAMVDPEAIFSQLFGGERFQDIIGTISLGSEMKSAMQGEEDEEETEETLTNTTMTTTGTTSSAAGKPILTPEQTEAKRKKKEAKELAEKKLAEQKAKVREERVLNLVEKLKSKLALFSEQAVSEEDLQIASGVRTMWSIEAEEMKQESYGVELLQTVGFVYDAKSKHFLATTGIIPFGVGGWFHSARSTAHIIGQTVSTVRSAYALKDVFEALAAAEKSGLSDEKKKELEDKAAQMGLHALFKGAKLEVESIIREVCDRILSEEGISTSTLRKRAVALGIMGECYMAVKKDENSNPPIGGVFGATAGSAPNPAAAATEKSAGSTPGYNTYKGAAAGKAR